MHEIAPQQPPFIDPVAHLKSGHCCHKGFFLILAVLAGPALCYARISNIYLLCNVTRNDGGQRKTKAVVNCSYLFGAT